MGKYVLVMLQHRWSGSTIMRSERLAIYWILFSLSLLHRRFHTHNIQRYPAANFIVSVPVIKREREQKEPLVGSDWLRKKVWSSSPLTVFNRWNSKNFKKFRLSVFFFHCGLLEYALKTKMEILALHFLDLEGNTHTTTPPTTHLRRKLDPSDSTSPVPGVNSDAADAFAFIYGVVGPTIVTFGLIGNILILFVVGRSRMEGEKQKCTCWEMLFWME